MGREKIMGVDVSAAALLAEFGSWLAGERGLSRETVRCYCNQAGTFLASFAGSGGVRCAAIGFGAGDFVHGRLLPRPQR